MKLFDVNWLAVLRDLPRWNALPTHARLILLNELKPHGYVPAHKFVPYLDAIVSSGIATYDHEKDRLWLGDERRGLVKVLRAMHRHPLFDVPAQHTLTSYLSEHFTGEEIQRIGGNRGRFASQDKYALTKRVAFSGWAGDLLDARNDGALLAWAESRGARIDPSRVELSATILRALQALARQLLAYPDGVAIRELLADPQNKDLVSLADAIYAGLGLLVIFAALRGRDFEPMIGLWPGAAHDLLSPAPQAPTTVEVSEHFSLAVEMEDMTTVMSAVAASPVRVRASDFVVFARTSAEIEKRLVALPNWSSEIFPAERVNHAARELKVRGFVRTRRVQDNPHLEATPSGMRWLALSPHDRVAALIDPLRESKDLNPLNAWDGSGVLGFFPYTLPYATAPKSLNTRDHLVRLFLGLPPGFIPVNDFLEYAARNDNPFLAMPPGDITLYSGSYYGGGGDPREHYRDMWRGMLFQFLCIRLIGLGGATIGVHEAHVCFSLTDVGRYLLGEGSGFEYGTHTSGDIVIQPNFDIVFLGAAPSVEAEIARFAERAGVAPGLAFRLTRASVLAAAEAGAEVSDVIGVLTRASSKPVPRNVQREIEGWMGAVRRATMRRVELLECADAESANRIVALLGDKVRQLTPTLFELAVTAPAARAALVKKLRVGGVFLADVTVRPEPKQTGRLRARGEDEWDE
ncbi:MAG: helicase-associated domain-containing protein [bacterium]